MASTASELVVLAGPNGAGKSTLAPWLLRDGWGIRDFVNADEIAKGLSGFQPETVALQAGRLMWERLEELAVSRKSFAFETTLASRTYAPWIVKRREQGYQARLVFIWLPSAEMAIQRVTDRVRVGGHHIPDDVIRRRYAGGLRNLFELYLPVIDRWEVLDGTEPADLRLVAQSGDDGQPEISCEATWSRINVHHKG